MQISGDDSTLHRLARCFGQGLALGVGLSLTQKALRPKGTQPERAFEPAPEPVAPAPPRAPAAHAPAAAAPAPAAAPVARTSLDLRAVQAIVSVVEQRIEERAARTERRIDEVKAAASLNVQAAVARQVEAGVAGLRAEVAKTHREFAVAVARIVSEQVAREVAKQTAAMEARVQQRIEAAVAPLHAELQDLRRRLAETENTMHEFASAISETVRMAGEQAASPAEWQPEAETEQIARTPRRTAVRRAGVARSMRRPQHLDLRVLRQRLQAAERHDSVPRLAVPPLLEAPVQRKQAQLVRFPVAS